ncbi:MAG: Hsp20/alpha crystallin family protein [bacterium]
MPINWQPFKDLERPLYIPRRPEQEEWMPFAPTLRSEEPAIDIYQDKVNLYVEIPLIGINPENINILIEDNILIIQGKGEEKIEINKKDYLRKEIKKGSFRRTIKLPMQVNENKAFAESDKGLLKITIPKVDKAISRSKKVPINIK